MINNQRVSLVPSPHVKGEAVRKISSVVSTAVTNSVKAGHCSHRLPLTWVAAHWPCQGSDEAVVGRVS